MQSYAITAAPQSGNQEKWLQSEKNGHFNAETSGRLWYFYKTKNLKERNRDILHKAQIARLVFMGVAKTFVVTESHSVTILAFPHFWGKRKACASISFDLNTSFHRNIKVGKRKSSQACCVTSIGCGSESSRWRDSSWETTKGKRRYNDDSDSGGDVNGDFDHGENYIDVDDGDDVTHFNIRSAPGKVYRITTSVIIMVMPKMVTMILMEMMMALKKMMMVWLIWMAGFLQRKYNGKAPADTSIDYAIRLCIISLYFEVYWKHIESEST